MFCADLLNFIPKITFEEKKAGLNAFINVFSELIRVSESKLTLMFSGTARQHKAFEMSTRRF
jgi:hypothetical protein